MIKVMIDESEALDMLMNRLCEFWHVEPTGDTETTYKLFETMYEDYLNEGVFESIEFDVMSIVDNDYVNWCSVVSEGDDNYEEVKKAYYEGDRETGNLRVEAEYDGSFLVRYC